MKRGPDPATLLSVTDDDDDNRRLVERLRELDDAKNDLMAAVSHDLRTPLTAILGFADLIEKRFDRFSADQIHEMVAEIAESARRMEHIIKGLLDKDRLAQGVIRPESSDVLSLVKTAADMVELDGHPLHVSCPPLEAVIDGAMVECIIENLVRNAVKHTSAGTEIWLTVTEQPEGLELVVADAGLGIDDEMKPAITERYHRGDTTAGGTGVGLSLVRKFAELHGGTLRIEDRPGGGALFRVSLPSDVQPAA